MNSVSLFIKSLVTITFMWCLAELILPDHSVKKYSSFVYGLVIISLTISVFMGIDYNSFLSFENDLSINENNSDYIKQLYEKKIEKALSEKFSDKSIKVQLNDQYKIEKIKCENQETYDEIVRYLNE